MTKTIEQAAREFAEENWTDFRACEWPKDYVTENLEYAFEEGAGHVLSLPLSQRLTDEEREKIKAKHNACRIAQTECDCLDYEIAADMLEEIFGKELFGEGEGC